MLKLSSMVLHVLMTGLFFFIFWFLLKRFVLERQMLRRCGKHVFITGCDSGFGQLLALRLSSQGVHVYAGCFTVKGQSDLREASVENDAVEFMHPLRLDITSDESVNQAYHIVRQNLALHNASLWGIVNNAGIFSIFGPDDWCTIDEYRNSLEVNTLGAIRICHKFISLLKHSKGRVVSMASSAGRLHGQFVGPYCTAKFAVEAYMDCLRFEMRPFGVSVHILEPGAFKTTLLSEEAQNQRVDNMWKKLPESIQMEYGVAFRDNFKKAWSMGVSLVANSNLDWVVDHYCHALFSLWPRYRLDWLGAPYDHLADRTLLGHQK